MNMSAPKRPRFYDKERDYATILEFVKKNPGHDKEFYIGNFSLLCAYSQEKSEEVFRLLKFARKIVVDGTGKVQIPKKEENKSKPTLLVEKKDER